MAKKEKKSRRKDEQGLAAAQREKNVTEKEREPKERKESPRPVPKSAAERKKDRRDGIVKTVFSAALGVLAGFGCYHLASSTGEYPWQIGEYPWHFILLSVLLATFLVQRAIYPLMGIDAARFKTKDWLYVGFIAVDLWLVTWTILLN